ncbi:MAG TPA: sensor histidine kinase, partial [Phototrophicaceae bacterium]|nr:sensor histidine kinase [Phototrophicaceae bacterium]
ALLIDTLISQSNDRQCLIRQLQMAQDQLAHIERQAGVLDERARLAGDLHDTLAQELAGIVMHLENLPPDSFETNPPLNQVLTLSRSSLNELRRLVWALRPEELEQQPFPEVMNNLVNHWSRDNGITARCVITGEPHPLAADTEVMLLRVTQEALTNIARHAHADEVTLTLSYMEEQTALDIHDNGIGFTPTLIRRSLKQGAGLVLMRDRVQRSGGELSIESVPDGVPGGVPGEGDGTTITVSVPIQVEDGDRVRAEVQA